MYGSRRPNSLLSFAFDNCLLLLQIFVKFTCRQHMGQMVQILEYARDICAARRSNLTEIYRRAGDIVQMIVKCTILTYSLIIFAVAIPSLLGYYLTGHLSPCVFAFFIGVDEYTNRLSSLLNGYNLIMLLHAAASNMAADSLILMTFVSFPLMSNIIESFVNELLQKLRDKVINVKTARCHLVQIILMNQKYFE